jgi:hypothetical protein
MFLNYMNYQYMYLHICANFLGLTYIHLHFHKYVEYKNKFKREAIHPQKHFLTVDTSNGTRSLEYSDVLIISYRLYLKEHQLNSHLFDKKKRLTQK